MSKQHAHSISGWSLSSRDLSPCCPYEVPWCCYSSSTLACLFNFQVVAILEAGQKLPFTVDAMKIDIPELQVIT